MQFILKIETEPKADAFKLLELIKDKAADILCCDGIAGVTLLDGQEHRIGKRIPVLTEEQLVTIAKRGEGK